MIAGVSITTLLLVLVAGIGAGFVGYAVGASSLISYPALLAFGIPPVLSNTTNTVGVCGTGIGGLLSARKELKGQGRRVAVYACIGLVGGIIGGLLLLELPAKVFEFAVPPPCSPASSSPSSLAVAPISKSLWFRSVACDRAAALRNDNFRFLVCRDSSWPGDLRRVCSQAGVP